MRTSVTGIRGVALTGRWLVGGVAAAILLLLFAPPAVGQQTGAVTGQVTSASTGEPLDGVQVFLVGGDVGTLTNSDGQYRLPGVSVGEQQIQASLIGFNNPTRTVEVQAGQATQLNFRLSESAVNLDQIVVTGQAGDATRREIGTSINQVSSEQIEERPVSSTQEILQGSSQGMAVLPNSGQAGAGSTIRLRGASSLTQSNEPLIYVDGVRIENGFYGGFKDNLNSVGSPNQSSRPLQDINPGNIERIEIIKGAAATTLYGTEAAGGVIQIFTKSGQGLQGDITRWNLDITGGLSDMRTGWPVNTTQQEKDLFIETYGPESRGLWMDRWLDVGSMLDAGVSVNRSSEDVSVFAAGRYQKEESVFPEQGSASYNVAGNFQFSPLQGLTIRLNNTVNQRNVDWISNGNEAEGFMVNVMRGPQGYTGVDNVDLVLDQEYDDNQTHWLSSLRLSYQPTTQLSANVTLGYDFIDSEQLEVLPFGAFFAPTGNRHVNRYRNENRSVDARVTYRNELTSGIVLNTATGVEMYQRFRKEVTASSRNFAGPHTPTLTSGSDRDVVENRLEKIETGWYAQERVGFADRLFLTGGIRVDGNSTFGGENEIQTYPSASISYVLSDEGFWPDVFEQFKIRGAWGQSGQSPGFFDADRVWSPVIRGEDEAAVTPDNRGNPDLGPETTEEFEAGVEASLIDGRLTFDGSAFRSSTTGAMVPVQQDPTLGFLNPQLRNIGEISNKGVEASIEGVPVEMEDLRWRLGGTVSHSSSLVEDLGGAPDVSLGNNFFAREGFPIAYFVNQVRNPQEMSEPDIAQDSVLGPSIPQWTGSLTTSVNVGNRLTLRGMGEYQGGHYIDGVVSELQTVRGVWPACVAAQQAMESGRRSELTAFERAKCDRNNAEEGPHYYEADFFRVREVSVSYDAPQFLVPSGFNSLRIRLAARNLALLTGYEGYDPEANELFSGGTMEARSSYYTLPPHKRFTLTVNASF